MKVLLAENPNLYTNNLAGYAAHLQPLQQALDAYTALGIATRPTTADLAELWATPRTFFVRMFTNGQPVQLTVGGSGGLAVNHERVYDLLEKPAGTDEFISLVTQLKKEQRAEFPGYELAEGQIVLTQAVKDKLLEESRSYATTQAQLDEWNELQVIAASLNKIRKFSGMAASFNTLSYLEKALEWEGRADDSNPVKPKLNHVLRSRSY